MFSGAINYLKDPWLVARIQEFFGVNVLPNNSSSTKETKRLKEESYTSRKVIKSNGSPTYELRANGYASKSHFQCQKELEIEADEQERLSKCNPKDRAPEINNYFWYYLFLFITELGGEIFYATFIPLWGWNVDAAVGRRTILVWAITMSIGQMLKDIIRWPRPACPPAVRLQNKWSQEYGMPSTHATVSVSIPFSVVFFSMNKYLYSVPVGLVIVVIWSSLICLSRVYLGMHTILDIIAGLLLATILMIPVIPLVDIIEYYCIANNWALAALILISIASIVYYPCSDKWTPTRGDTTMVVAITAGIHAGTWLNIKTGLMMPPFYPPPYSLSWPSYPMFLRTLLGICCILPIKTIFKTLTYKIICAILKIDSKELMASENSLENRNKTLVELIYKYMYCFFLGVQAFHFVPRLFTFVGLERPEFYTEM